MNYRIYVKKKKDYTIDSQELFHTLKDNLEINLQARVTKYVVYDLFNCSESDYKLLTEGILIDKVTDELLLDLKIEGSFLAYESIPGQYNQRNDAATQCLQLFNPKTKTIIKSSTLITFDEKIDLTEMSKIKQYLINPLENQEKDLNKLELVDKNTVSEIPNLEGFLELDEQGLKSLHQEQGLALSFEDLRFIQDYFKKEARVPTLIELKVLDTYWSDHCRHTTFETILSQVTFTKDKLSQEIEKSYQLFQNLNQKYNKNKPETLMNMATIVGKSLKTKGILTNVEESEEVNACSVIIKVEEDGNLKEYLLMFKNETHNHPTEIEPFGGASTCLGGAIRDPLSGRSYVYQAMRISGAADITLPISQTLPNKLPQRTISKEAALGYSSYGNQIGLATTFVKEIYHPDYVAKRMEVGAVVGAVEKEAVIRKSPLAGDLIVLLGGGTGRDGIGGATGSSKSHDAKSLTTSVSEVQKGNAIIERKIQRLFRNKKCTALIKKANDFGAGGVSVAVGELADGVEIQLDKLPPKYEGLNALELALSESQERMACVVAPQDYALFCEYAEGENLTPVVIAKVTEEASLVMKYYDQEVVRLSRDFLDTNGVRNYQEVIVEGSIQDLDFINKEKDLLSNLKQPNTASQQGLVEMFDATVGGNTVLMPYGGKYQLTEVEASVSKIPVFGSTNTASILSYGFNPDLSKASPYLGGSYSVVEALAKITSVGGDYKKSHLTCQEYFQKLETDAKLWGKPTQALLGLIQAQTEFEVAAIGGKDSMSGSYNDIHVPPTLITFAITTENVSQIISSEFKKTGNYIYLVKHPYLDNYLINYPALKNNYQQVYQLIKTGLICSSASVKYGGIAETLSKMSFGNKIGIDVKTQESIYGFNLGSLIVESNQKINEENFVYLGKTIKEPILKINSETVAIEDAIKANQELYQKVYPITVDEKAEILKTPTFNQEIQKQATQRIEKPLVIIPVFPGTNCEYDCQKAFEKAGGKVEVVIFNNSSQKQITESLQVLSKKIERAQILMLAGGFSSGDEPDGSAKFISAILRHPEIDKAIQKLLNNDGLILGICNGFQALIKTGLLPYGKISKHTSEAPTLFKNKINRHISKMANIKITSNNSPWLADNEVGEIYTIPISHGEGRIMIKPELAEKLFKNGQIATQYVNHDGNVSTGGDANYNGSDYAIEGLLSQDGRIFGKMAHNDRYNEGIYKNIDGKTNHNIFENGINYFKKGQQ